MKAGLALKSTVNALAVSEAGGWKSEKRRDEYLLVIYPSGDMQDKLLEEQRQFSAAYGLQWHNRNKPHITAARFYAEEEMEDTLIRWIQRICSQHCAFEMMLNNYSGFPPHTVYLRVQDPQYYLQMLDRLKAVDEYLVPSGCAPINLVTRPYISIALGLTEQVYSKAMPDYSRKDFHEGFLVRELVLLKRSHAFDACKTVNVFRLLPDDLKNSSILD